MSSIEIRNVWQCLRGESMKRKPNIPILTREVQIIKNY